MYTQEDLEGMSVEELINLVNQITDERNLYRDKCRKLLEEKKCTRKKNCQRHY